MSIESSHFLFFAIIAVAYYVRGIAGYGSGLLAIPALALFWPLETVVPLIGALDLLAAVVHGIRYHRQAMWREIWLLLPIATLGMALGLYIFGLVDTRALTPWLGGFIILYALYTLLPGLQFQASRRWSLPLITGGGIVDTLFGTGGPFYVIYLRMRQLDKTVFVATLASCFVLTTGIRIGGYAVSGFYNSDLLWWLLEGLPVMAMAMYLGIHTHGRLAQLQFNRLIAVLLIAAGALLLMRD